MKHFFLTLIFFTSTTSLACSVPPQTLYQSNEMLVLTSPAIVLARAVSVKDKHIQGEQYEFTFETTRILKGLPPKTFSLIGYNSNNLEYIPTDFEGHRSKRFWAFNTGNTIQPGNCIAYGIFNIGEEYLIFLRTDSHYRGFENIRSNNDFWLQIVELLIENENAQKQLRTGT